VDACALGDVQNDEIAERITPSKTSLRHIADCVAASSPESAFVNILTEPNSTV
jgi:hypothetical protein